MPRPRGCRSPICPCQGGDPTRLRRRRLRPRLRLTPGGLSAGILMQPLGTSGQAQGAVLQMCGTQSEFTRHFPASSHKCSAKIRIDLGRTFLRIHRRRAALWTALSPREHVAAGACRGSGHVAVTQKTRQDGASHPGSLHRGAFPEQS